MSAFQFFVQAASVPVISVGTMFVHCEHINQPNLAVSVVHNDKCIITEPVATERVSVVRTNGLKKPEFQPKTAMGKALWEARKRIVASGEPLLPASELMAALDESRT